MNIRDYSSQFTVFIFDQNVDRGTEVRVDLSRLGYDSYFFQDEDTFFSRLQEMVPHIVIFDSLQVPGNLSVFIEKVLKISLEIKFILLSKYNHFETLAKYSDYGLMDIIVLPEEKNYSQVMWSVDRVCERLYLQYQNENLYRDLKKIKQQGATEGHGVVLQQQIIDRVAHHSIQVHLSHYQTSESLDELINHFMNHVAGIKCVYFRYLSSIKSFVATHAAEVLLHNFQGLSCQLDTEESRDLDSQLVVGLVPYSVGDLVSSKLSISNPKILAHFSAGQLEGIFVYPGDLTSEKSEFLQEEFSLFNICYNNLNLEKKIDQLEIQDPVTELYNKKYYLRKLDEELFRARRLKLPLSVIKIALDDFREIEQTLGENTRDHLLKSVGQLIAKSSRANDTTCRTQHNEISAILPSCSKKGAVLRAERIRRIVEGAQLLENGMKISVSVGISEYPSLSENSDSLDESSAKALGHIIEKGGNKICLFKVPEDFKPEFDVQEIS